MRCTMEVEINPFEDDIVEDPRNVKTSVSSLNKDPLKKLLDNFQFIGNDRRPGKSRLSHASLIISAEPGNGKSHLIGRLFHELNQKSTLVYIRPFENISTCWKSILLKIVQELCFPDKLDLDAEDNELSTQLEVFSHGILIYLLCEMQKSSLIQANELQYVKKICGKTELPEQWNDTVLCNWVCSNLDRIAPQFVEQLRIKGITMNASPLSWIKVLLNSTYNRSNIVAREACHEWFKGECIDLDEANMAGIRSKDISHAEMTSDEINELCKFRVFDFCNLASFFRPFIFCFDQTENYGKSRELVRTFGIVIENLIDACPNQMTVVTANQTPWTSTLLPHLEEAHSHRFSAPLELEGIDKEQGKELIKQRLSDLDSNGDNAQFFIKNSWLDNLFKNNPQIGIRRFINACRDEWDKGKNREIKKVTIDNYFGRDVKAIASQPKSHLFEPDILYWLIFEVAKGLKGITVNEHVTEKGYFVIEWVLEQHSILFGFESGSNSMRWRSIVREAKRYSIAKKGLKAVMLRTYGMPVIPKPTWGKIGPEISAAKKEYLEIIELDKNSVIEIYAAYKLYRDSVEADISYTGEEVLEFIRNKLQWFWNMIVKDSSVKKKNANKKTKPDTATNNSEAIINEIRSIIKMEKLLNVEELQTKLSIQLIDEQIFDLCKKTPQIKVHKSPEITILQWQSNQ